MKHSDQVNEIAAALAKAQAEIGVAVKRNTATVTSKKGAAASYKYEYADLAAVLHVCRETLSKHGLARTHSTHIDGSRLIVTTKLVHTSGQWFSSEFPAAIGDSDPQSLGSAQTYGIRYGLLAVCGIATDWDDDDGSAAQASATGGKSATQKPTTLGREFADGLLSRLKEAGQTLDDLRAVMEKAGLAHLAKEPDPANWSFELQDRIKPWVNAKLAAAKKKAPPPAAEPNTDEFPD